MIPLHQDPDRLRPLVSSFLAWAAGARFLITSSVDDLVTNIQQARGPRIEWRVGGGPTMHAETLDRLRFAWFAWYAAWGAQDAARQQERAALHDAMGFSTAYPLLDVLEQLAGAAEHLLEAHSCDQHGWEVVSEAAASARRILPALRDALARP